MPTFAKHIPTGEHGWITGTTERADGVYMVAFRPYPYDENRPWWNQIWPKDNKGPRLVRLDDLQIITTEQAILLGLLIERVRSSSAT